ncbi:MAG TPA: hypothetical protein VLX68_13690 [Chitinivibrionales bacterium]|nr:hypothetical protein [Chitinivibrionales bacterium]
MQPLLPDKGGALFDMSLLTLALFTVAALHIADLAIDPDDKCFYRAASFVTNYAHVPLTGSIKTHLTEIGLGDPFSRLQYSKYYFANNFLVDRFERLPLVSPFQSVFCSNLACSFAGIAALFFVLMLLFGRLRFVLFPAFLISATSSIFILHGLFPFDNAFFGTVTWKVPYPRGAATLFFFAGMMCFVPSEATRVRRYVRFLLGTALFALCGICHVGELEMFLPFFLVCVIAFVLLKKKITVDTLNIGKLLLIINCVIGVIVVCKTPLMGLYLLLRHGIPLGAYFSAVFLKPISMVSVVMFVAYLLETNALIVVWLKMRKKSTDTRLAKLGDYCFALFVAAAVISVGLYPLYTTSFDGPYDNLFFFFNEATRRIIAVPHVLFWMVLGIALYFKIGGASERRWARLAGLWLVLILLSAVMTIYTNFKDHRDILKKYPLNKELLFIKAMDLSEQNKAGLTESEIYHAIANQYRFENPSRYHVK